MINKYDKHYFEVYALLCLNITFRTSLSINDKSEHPDWFSEELSLGLEVTSSMSENNREILSYANEYFGSGLDANYISNEIKKRIKKYSTAFKNYNSTSYVPIIEDYHEILDRIVNCIIEKSEKISDRRKTIKQLDLFIFAFVSSIDDNDVLEIIKRINGSSIFDSIYIDCIDRIYRIKGDKHENKKLNCKHRRKIKNKALILSSLLKQNKK